MRDDRSSDWSLKGICTRLSEKIAARRGAKLQGVGTLDSDAVDSVIARPGWSPAQKAFVHTMYEALTSYVPRRYAGRVVFETGTQPLFHLRQVGAAWRAITDAPEIVPVRGNNSGLVHDRNSGFLATEVERRLDANDRVSSRLVMSRRGEDPVRYTRCVQ